MRCPDRQTECVENRETPLSRPKAAAKAIRMGTTVPIQLHTSCGMCIVISSGELLVQGFGAVFAGFRDGRERAAARHLPDTPAPEPERLVLGSAQDDLVWQHDR